MEKWVTGNGETGSRVEGRGSRVNECATQASKDARKDGWMDGRKEVGRQAGKQARRLEGPGSVHIDCNPGGQGSTTGKSLHAHASRMGLEWR